MMRIFATNEFCSGSKRLVSAKCFEEVHKLRTVLILLANKKPIPKKYKDHQLSDSSFRELHIAGDVLLLYKYESDSDTLTISLKLADITDHKKLKKDSHRKDYQYHEVTTTDLHDITSSINIDIDDLDAEILNDVLESISDYASSYTHDGYVLLEDFFVDEDTVHCEYGYYSYETDELEESIEYIIDLDRFNIIESSDLIKYVDQFSREVGMSFE